MLTRAITAHAAGDLRFDTVELEEPAVDEAVVAVRYGGICGSDLHYWRSGRVGESIIREPLVLGHEVVGVIERAAADGSGPGLGAPVFVQPATVCGHCERCLEGRRNLCPQLGYLGSAARLPHTPGGFADHLVVAADRLLAIGDLPLEVAALIEPASVSWHAISRYGSAPAPRRIAVIGAGPIGALCVSVARRVFPGSRIGVSDMLPRPLDAALRIGADTTVLAGDAEREFSEWAPDLVVESSGTGAGFAQALRVVRPGGTVIAVGQLPAQLEPPAQLIVGRELTVLGSSRFAGEAAVVTAALRDGSLVVDGIVTDILPADHYLAAFELAGDPARSGKVLLDFGSYGR